MLSRRAGRLLDLDATASLAGVGLLGSSPFTLVGDPATDNVLPTGELTLDDLTGEALAGIGVNTGTDTSTGGIIAPPPGTASPDGTGGEASSSSTGTSGIPGTLGLTPGSGGVDGSATSFAPLRPSVAGSGGLPFTGAASDLLALVAFGLLVAGALVVRATRPAAAREGGDDR